MANKAMIYDMVLVSNDGSRYNYDSSLLANICKKFDTDMKMESVEWEMEKEIEQSIEENKDLLCPITHSIMKNPYIDKEGNSYEKDAIIEWLSQRQTSPLTKNKLTLEDLVPNRALKNIIQLTATKANKN